MSSSVDINGGGNTSSEAAAEPTGTFYGDWEEFKRSNDGKLYYANEKTGATQWVKPSGAATAGPAAAAAAPASAPASPKQGGGTGASYRTGEAATTNTTPYSKALYALHWFSGLTMLFWTVLHVYSSVEHPTISRIIFTSGTIGPANTYAAQIPFLVMSILVVRWAGRMDTLRGHVLAAIVTFVLSMYWLMSPIRSVLNLLGDDSGVRLTEANCTGSEVRCDLQRSYASACIITFVVQFFWMVYAIRTAYVAVGANTAPTMGYDQLGKPLLGLIAFALVGYVILVCSSIATNVVYNEATGALWPSDITLRNLSPFYLILLAAALGVLAYNVLGAPHLFGVTVAIVGVATATFWSVYPLHANRTTKYWSTLNSQCGGTVGSVAVGETDACGAQRAQAAGLGLINIALLLMMVAFAVAKFKGWN